MKGFAKLLAVLLLALGPAALLSVMPTQAQPYAGEKRAERQAARQAQRQAGRVAGQVPAQPQGGNRGRAYTVAPPAPYPGYGQPAPYTPPVYSGPPQGYTYPPTQGYANTPPPNYSPPPSAPYPNARYPNSQYPNSLGAEWGQQQNQARNGVARGQMMPLAQVIQRLKRANPGRLLDAGLEPGPDGRPAYRVRWAAAGGRRVDFIVDAVTGAVVARSGY